MATILFAFPGQYTPAALLQVMPVCEVAHLFWMAYVYAEERIRRELEAHAYTAWWVHRSIELAEGVKHHDWDEWCNIRGLRWKSKPLKSRDELIAETYARYDALITPNTRFTQGG